MQICQNHFGLRLLTWHATLLTDHRARQLMHKSKVWTGKPINYSNLKIFGRQAYVHVQEQQRSKLDPKSKQCIFFGYEKGMKGYKLWDPVARQIVISEDVVFNEEHMLNLNRVEVQKTRVAHAKKFSVQVELDEIQRPNKEDDAPTFSQEETSCDDG